MINNGELDRNFVLVNFQAKWNFKKLKKKCEREREKKKMFSRA